MTGDCRAVLPTLAADSFDSVVTDPPYELGFMGKGWDRSGVANDPATWRAALRVLKPGGYMLCFGGTRTYHRLACAVEDAGFEIRDCLMWIYGTGFPKGQGCLKPAWEPILLCRKPGKRVLPLSIDACRVGTETIRTSGAKPGKMSFGSAERDSTGSHIWNGQESSEHTGRYPANVVHDGSEEVLEAFAAFGEKASGKPGNSKRRVTSLFVKYARESQLTGFGDTGLASRFFYCAKASKAERNGSKHPTVKPLALMRWCVRLVTPVGGSVLDPFAGSGTTLEAAALEGMIGVGIEQDAANVPGINKRLARAREQEGLFAIEP